jgi:hypothetical protein
VHLDVGELVFTHLVTFLHQLAAKILTWVPYARGFGIQVRFPSVLGWELAQHACAVLLIQRACGVYIPEAMAYNDSVILQGSALLC